ncbi:MAG TPA: hypothetical protein VHG51_05090, partial [Longimicrobiaceae bacterium]|nr:hypothetical protein [Longimicrobiaceae bacterium]
MRLPKLLSPWLILLAAVLPAAAHAQRAAGLRVVVREDGTGRAIPGAQVVVGGVGTVAVSDSTGVAHSPSVPLGQRLV